MNGSFKDELKTVLKAAKWEFFLKFFISVLLRGILLIIPLLFSEAINCVTKGDQNRAIFLIVVSIVVAAVYRFFEGYNQVCFYKLYDRLFLYYNDLGIKKTKDNSLFSLSRFSPGQYTNIVITDVDIVAGFFANGVLRVVQIIEYLVIFIYFWFIDIYIFGITVIVSTIMLIVAIKSGNRIQKYNEKRKVNLDKMTTSMYDYFGAIREIKSFNIFEKIYPMTIDKSKDYLSSNTKYNVRFNCDNSAFLFVFELFRLLVIIYAIFEIGNGNMDVGILLVLYNYYQKIIDNFSIILTTNVDFRSFKVSLQRFNKVLEYSKKCNNGLVINKDDIKGNINFNNVLYGFRENPILNKITFSIPENSITVLSGNDESSQVGIFDLLLKLNRQHEGTISIDDYLISDISDECYYSIVSSIRRQTIFFDISIKDNFLMVNDDFDKIVDMCKLMGIDDEINSLEKGYDTILTDNTPITLSFKKMLVIVRMLLKESKILLFDDVVNVLEEKYEKRLIELMMNMKSNHTIVMVTNSKRIIDRADLVLDISSNNVNVVKE